MNENFKVIEVDGVKYFTYENNVPFTYSFIAGKKRVIELVKRQTMDFISDMMQEISTASKNGCVGDVKMFVEMIEQAEQFSVEVTEKINKAVSLGDIIKAIADDDTPGNILFEQDDEVLTAFFNTKFKCNEIY
jgi:nitrogen regulatory protein PII